MAEGKVPYLAGCVLYLLLRQATLPDASARQHQEGVKDEHKNPRFMADLVYTFSGVDMPESDGDTSRYRNGQKEGTVNIPFDDPATIASYDEAVRNRYPDVLKRMRTFAKWHLNPEKREWFVKACLDLIEQDESIADTDVFCIKSNGSFLSKEKLRTETEFEFEPVIIGMLHFILMHRAGKNYLGVPTLDKISTRDSRKQRRYSGNLGSGIRRQINVRMYEDVSEPDTVYDTNAGDSGPEKNDDEVITENLAHSIGHFADALQSQKHEMAEQIRQNSRKEESSSGSEIPDDDAKQSEGESRTTIIKQQTNVIQHGDNNVNVTNNGTITINL